MKEQFVTYEIAAKLSELGFYENCLGFYYDKCEDNGAHGGEFESMAGYCEGREHTGNLSSLDFIILAPLWQQVQKWLREKHQLHITVNFELSMKWWFSVDRSPYDESDDVISFPVEIFEGFETYDGALEAGIQYALTLVK